MVKAKPFLVLVLSFEVRRSMFSVRRSFLYQDERRTSNVHHDGQSAPVAA
jgi:hypothetical protein